MLPSEAGSEQIVHSRHFPEGAGRPTAGYGSKAREPCSERMSLCIGFTACHLPGIHGGRVRWEIDGGSHIDFRLYHVLPVRTLYFYFCIDVRSSPPRADCE